MRYKLSCYLIGHRWEADEFASNIRTCKRCGWRRAKGWSVETGGKVVKKMLSPE